MIQGSDGLREDGVALGAAVLIHEMEQADVDFAKKQLVARATRREYQAISRIEPHQRFAAIARLEEAGLTKTDASKRYREDGRYMDFENTLRDVQERAEDAEVEVSCARNHLRATIAIAALFQTAHSPSSISIEVKHQNTENGE